MSHTCVCPHEGCEYFNDNPIALNGKLALLKHCSKVHEKGYRKIVLNTFSNDEKCELKSKYKNDNKLKDVKDPPLNCMFGTGYNWENNTIECCNNKIKSKTCYELRIDRY